MWRWMGWCLLVCVMSACDRPGDASASVSAEGAGVSREGGMMRGVVVSCYRNGPGEWDGPGMRPLLEELRGLGVDAIQVHPYARISSDGRVGYRRDAYTPATLTPIRLAKQRGMTALLKPHLAYWGSGFSWRGEVTFSDEAHWAEFFRGYESFIVHQAELAEQAGADVFAVGTELHKTLGREADWRRVIAAVRGVYSGKLTYAANWDEQGDVPFWDAMDFVGVQFYYPLSEALPPSDEQLVAGWRKRLAELREVSAAHGKPVLLTELGYAVSEEAALRPWSDAAVGDRAAGHELKLRCMRVALQQIESEPTIAGVFLWKWFPGGRDHSDEFVLQYDAMRDVIRGAWAKSSESEKSSGGVRE